MNPTILSIGTAILLATTSIPAMAREIPLASTPAAVQQTVREHQRKGKVDEVKLVSVSGRKMYVVEIDLPTNKDLKLYISEQGQLIKTREDGAFRKLPAAVKQTVKGLIPAGGKVDDVDIETADGRVTYFVEIDRPEAPDLKVTLSENGDIIRQVEDRD